MKKVLFFVILVFVLGLVGFFFLNISHKPVKSKIELVSKYKNLKIDNSLPISDEIAINKTNDEDGYLDFSIKSLSMNGNGSKYEVYVKQINSVNSINGNYIKLYLSEKNTNRPLTKYEVFNSLPLSSFDMESRKLYRGTIKKGETINLNLRMWLSDNYTISNEKRNFEIVLGVRTID